MLGAGPVTPTALAEAEIKDKLGDFFQNEKKLLPLSQHPNVQIKGEANILYNAQQDLNNRLQDVLATIDRWKLGQWQLAEPIEVGAFAYELLKHNKDVDRLLSKAKQAAGSPSKALLPMPGDPAGFSVRRTHADVFGTTGAMVAIGLIAAALLYSTTATRGVARPRSKRR